MAHNIQEICNFLQTEQLTSEGVTQIFNALMKNATVIGGKVWTKRDLFLENYGGILSYLSEEQKDIIVDNVNSSVLNECFDEEWDALHEAINSSRLKVVIIFDNQYEELSLEHFESVFNAETEIKNFLWREHLYRGDFSVKIVEA